MMKWKGSETRSQKRRLTFKSSRRSRGSFGWQTILEEEVRILQAGEDGRGSCASESNGCYDSAVVEQLFTLGATHARQQIPTR